MTVVNPAGKAYLHLVDITGTAQPDSGKKVVFSEMHGGGGGPMDPTVSIKDYVDARDEAIETRLMAKLDRLPTKGTIWGAVASAVGVVLGILALAGDRFDGGMSISPIITELKLAQGERDNTQDAKLKEMDGKLDVLIERTAE